MRPYLLCVKRSGSTTRTQLIKQTVACDTETTGLNSWQGAQPYVFSFCWEDGRTQYFRASVNPFTRRVTYSQEMIRKLKEIYEDPSVTKVFHHAKFDIRMMNSIGIQVKGQIEDTLTAIHCLRSDEPEKGLKPLSMKYLGISTQDQADLHSSILTARRKAKRLGYRLSTSPDEDSWLGDPAACKRYAIQDVRRTLGLWNRFRGLIVDEGVEDTYRFEMSLIPVTMAMESWGVRLHMDLCQSEMTRYKEQEVGSLAKIHYMAGEAINPGSGPEVRKFLFETLKLQPAAWTPTGLPSCNIQSIRVMTFHPATRALQEWRAAKKALAYLKKYKSLQVDGVLHPDFLQIGPNTGRYSCKNPNMQQTASPSSGRSEIPIDTRTPLGPRPGYVWYLYDYSQIEVRVFAWAAQEQRMIEAIRIGRNIHWETGNAVFGHNIRAACHTMGLDYEVLKNRDKAEAWLRKYGYRVIEAEESIGQAYVLKMTKQLVFAIIYGGGAQVISQGYDWSLKDSQDVINMLHNQFPGIRPYFRVVGKQILKDGFVRTLYGRKIWVPLEASYRGVNYVVQGTSADLMKRGMMRVHNFFQEARIDGHISATIHDELITEIRLGQDTPYVINHIGRLMTETEGKIGVPIQVKCKRAARSWGDTEAVKLED